MRKTLARAFVLLPLIFCLSGCSAVGEKSASLTIVYGIAAVLSLVLMICYCCFVKKRSMWFIVMFSSILVVNVGYFCLSASSSLGEALLANRIAYLGQVFLPMAMLMIIFKVTNTEAKNGSPTACLH